MSEKGEEKIMFATDGERLYTTGQAAKVAGVTRQAVHKWIVEDKLSAEFVMSMFWTIRESVLMEYVERRNLRRSLNY